MVWLGEGRCWHKGGAERVEGPPLLLPAEIFKVLICKSCPVNGFLDTLLERKTWALGKQDIWVKIQVLED